MKTKTPTQAQTPSQMQMFYAADRRFADANEAFLFCVKEGMTREELATNIKRRPATWERFSNFLDKLPSSSTSQPNVNHQKFSVSSRYFTQKNNVFDIFMGSKRIATCFNSEGAQKLAASFEALQLVDAEAYRAAPHALRMAFIGTANELKPMY